MNKLPLLSSFLLLTFFCVVLSSCSKVRESAGVNRKVIDEYNVVKSPPLALPPDYNLLPSEEIIARKKNLSNDQELAKEILFGLNEDSNQNNSVNTSSALDSILEKSGADKASNNIRDEIDTQYANISSTRGVFSGEKYMTDEEILDAAAESKRIRENIFNNKDILEGENPITTRPKERKSLLKRIF